MKKLEFEEILKCKSGNHNRFPIAVMIEDIRSLYNVGSIFRTCDGAAVEKLYLGGYTGFPPRKEIEKTALGSTESVPWEKCEDVVKKLENLKKDGYSIVVCEHTDSSIEYSSAEYNFPLCLVFGNEVEGVSQKICDIADFSIEIPMLGAKQSLNVSVAAGIIMYRVAEFYINKNNVGVEKHLFSERIKFIQKSD